MLKILQVATFFNEHGGVEKSVSDLCHGLSEKHRVSVLCTARGSTRKTLQNKVQVAAMGSRLAIAGRPLALSFVSELASQRVDVVHYHLPCPMAILASTVAKPSSKITVATWHHDLVRHKLLNAIMSPWIDRFLRNVDSIIVTAPGLIDSTPMLRRHRNKCKVIPLGIDEHRLSALPGDDDAVLDIRKQYKGPLILFVGRLVYYKGCEVLIRAMRNVDDGVLVMVGAGPLLPSLLALIKKEGLEERVHLLGRQPDTELRRLLQACDVFVLPSTLPTECFGLVQVEAMMCGKPVINTDLPTGVPWVSVDGETGLTVSPSNSADLASAINLLLADQTLRRRLGINARARASQLFTLKKQLSSTVAHYEQLLDSVQSSQSPANMLR